MRAILDRYEGAFAILELDGGGMLTAPRQLFPDSIREGDMIEIELENNRLHSVKTLPDESEKHRKRITDKYQKLLNKESLK